MRCFAVIFEPVLETLADRHGAGVARVAGAPLKFALKKVVACRSEPPATVPLVVIALAVATTGELLETAASVAASAAACSLVLTIVAIE